MYYIKYDTNRNNTITEYSKTPIIDIGVGEITGTTTYDFPTSQPAVYNRYETVGGFVEPNDEDTINSYREDEGVMEGLDLDPFISTVVGSDFLPNTTKEIILNGTNFSPFSTMTISGDGNFVDTVYFDSPQQLRASVTVNGVEGLYNLTVKNSELTSKESGYNKILVKAKNELDFRTILIADMGLEMTDGITAEQDSERGVTFKSNSASWNRGVIFTSYFWNRSDDITFEVVFTKTSDVNFMVGIASATLDVAGDINSAYYKQEIGMFHNNNKLASIYGGGDVSNWSQGIGKTVIFDTNKFYKLKLESSGGLESRCSILEVEADDWDAETEIHSWTSTCPADDELLVPFVLPQASSGGYYITGIRY